MDPELFVSRPHLQLVYEHNRGALSTTQIRDFVYKCVLSVIGGRRVLYMYKYIGYNRLFLQFFNTSKTSERSRLDLLQPRSCLFSFVRISKA